MHTCKTYALSRWPCWRDTRKHCERLKWQEDVKMSTEPGAIPRLNIPLPKWYLTTVKLQPSFKILVPVLRFLMLLHSICWLVLLATSLLRANTGAAERSRCQASSRVVGEKQSQTSMEEIAPHSDSTKVYCTQWQNLRLYNGVLYCLWETLSRDQAADTSQITKVWCFTTQYPNGWIPGSYQDPESCQGKIVLIPWSANKMSENGATIVIFVHKNEDSNQLS